MSPVVKNITRVVAGFIVLFGAYIVLYGHVTPGGGFKGGVILAGGLALVVLAFGEEFARNVLTHEVARMADSMGALLFLLVAVLGFMGGVFFTNFLPPGTVGTLVSAGTIPIANLGIGIKVGAGLFGVFVALAAFRRTSAGRKKDVDALQSDI
jgi:multicomponent Na+:H+ antiporter subunit B